jgi:nanoRNase/pAp phosphatase (c-di-AMP/oligoRNAs hydrolase)
MGAVKVLIAGEGSKTLDIAKSLASKNRAVTIVSKNGAEGEILENSTALRHDPGTVRLDSLGLAMGDQDVAIIVGDDPADLRRAIENLKTQVHAENLVVIASDETVRRDYPDLIVRTETSIYREEFHEMMKRIQARKRLAEIREIARKAEKVLVIIWGNPDPDAMASAFALKTLLEEDAKAFEIAYTGVLSRPENIAMADTLDIPMRRFSMELIMPGTSVFTVDAQPSFFRFDGPVAFDVVIDHHPKEEEPACKVADVRTTYGATSTILTEYFLHNRRKIPRRVATALFFGLKTDTNNLTRNVSEADIRAFRLLRNLSDENIIRTIELSQMPMEVLGIFDQAIARKKIGGKTLLAHIGDVKNTDYPVYIADFFMRISGISAVIVSARHEQKLVVIFRSNGLRIDIGRIAERVLGPYGTAGGHRTMARAELDLSEIRKEALSLSEDALERWLVAKLSPDLKGLQHLLPARERSKTRRLRVPEDT